MAKESNKMQMILALVMYLLLVSMTISIFLGVVNPIAGEELNGIEIQVSEQNKLSVTTITDITGYFITIISPFTVIMDETIFPSILYIPFITFPKFCILILLISLILPGA